MKVQSSTEESFAHCVSLRAPANVETANVFINFMNQNLTLTKLVCLSVTDASKKTETDASTKKKVTERGCPGLMTLEVLLKLETTDMNLNHRKMHACFEKRQSSNHGEEKEALRFGQKIQIWASSPKSDKSLLREADGLVDSNLPECQDLRLV